MSNPLFLVHLMQNMKKILMRYGSCSRSGIPDYFLLLGGFEYCILQGASAVPKKTVKALGSTSALSAGGLDSLPREDISGKITPALLKGLESPDWKVWLFAYL